MAGFLKGRERCLGRLGLWGWLGTAFSLFSQGLNRLDGWIRSSFSFPKDLFCVWVKRWRREGSENWRWQLTSNWGWIWRRKERNWSCLDGCHKGRWLGDSRSDRWRRRCMPDWRGRLGEEIRGFVAPPPASGNDLTA